jgi:hypothetical protein
MVSERSEVGLLGRSSEIRILEELATAVRSRRGAAVVNRGEAGIGKTFSGLLETVEVVFAG